MRAIVVGIDFLNESISALKMAVTIGAKSDSKLVLVFVNKPDNTKPIFRTPPEKLKDEVDKRFKELKKQYANLITEENFVCKFKDTLKVEQAIHEEVEDARAELVVIGTHGKPGLKLFKHSLAYQIAEKSTVPVITARDGALISDDIKTILIPIDDTLETRQKVPFTVRLAKLFGAEIHMLAIYHSTVQTVKENVERYTRQSAEYLEGNNMNFVVKSIETKDMVNETIKYATDINADLISIMTIQIGNVSNLWKGTFTEQLIDQSPIPVVIVPHKELIRTLSR